MKKWFKSLFLILVIGEHFKKIKCSEFEAEKNNIRLSRSWVWSDGSSNNYARTTTTTKPELDTNHPCGPFAPKKPNFDAPNRRLSEIKCLEYIWDMRRREEVARRSEACTAYQATINAQFYAVKFAIGGRSTTPGEFPHMGALGWRAVSGTWIFRCGSSLISPKFLLTAAHCSKSRLDTNIANPVPEIVRLGDKNILDEFANGMDPIDEKILRIINHPNFASPKKYFDIALVELVKEVEFSNYVQPACLWTNYEPQPLIGAKATLTGWGVIETAGRKTSPELQAAVVDVIDSQFCDQLLRPSCNRLWCGIEEHQICAGKLAGGVDACQGDSGGPLQVKINIPFPTNLSMHYVIGVTSFGIGCARENLPGIYTRVSSFVDWIEGVVWEN